MRILLTGANGVLASEVIKVLNQSSHDIVKTDIKKFKPDIKSLDICDRDGVFGCFESEKPDYVLHFAAETDVDLCQQEPAHAFSINASGTKNVALACKALGIKLVYTSTAMVFNGNKQAPYIEIDKTDPVNVYGKSKLEGELAIRSLLKDFFIIRISWLIGSWDIDKKFVHNIIQQVRQGKKQIKAVNDRFGSPTFACDFAGNLLDLLSSGKYGLYHMSNKGTCSRHELAKKTVEFLGFSGKVVVNEASSNKFPLPAPRPVSEMMLNKNLELLKLNNMPGWEASLKKHIEGIKNYM